MKTLLLFSTLAFAQPSTRPPAQPLVRPAPASTQTSTLLSFEKNKSRMLASLRDSLAEIKQQRDCLALEMTPQGMKSTCDLARVKLVAKLTREIKMQVVMIPCLEKATNLTSYSECSKQEMARIEAQPIRPAKQ